MPNLKKVGKGKSKLDRLKDYLYSPDKKVKLSKTQLASFNRYKEVFAIMSQHPRQCELVAAVESTCKVGYRQALRIIKETNLVFGDQMKVDRKVAKFNIYQKQLQIADDLYQMHIELVADDEKAEAVKALDKASKAYEKAAEMYDLKAHQEEKKGINAKMFFKQVNVYRTTDPEVIKGKVPKAFREGEPTKTIDITPENLSIDDID